MDASKAVVALQLARARFQDAVASPRTPTTPAHGLFESRCRIDGAFVRGPLRASSGHVHGSVNASDHYPISFILDWIEPVRGRYQFRSAAGEVGRKVPAGSCALGPRGGELKKSRGNRGVIHGDFHGGEAHVFANYALPLHLDRHSFLPFSGCKGP
jgi:hypothetical protein